MGLGHWAQYGQRTQYVYNVFCCCTVAIINGIKKRYKYNVTCRTPLQWLTGLGQWAQYGCNVFCCCTVAIINGIKINAMAIALLVVQRGNGI